MIFCIWEVVEPHGINITLILGSVEKIISNIYVASQVPESTANCRNLPETAANCRNLTETTD